MASDRINELYTTGKEMCERRRDSDQNRDTTEEETFAPTINQPTEKQAAEEGSEEPVFDRLYTHARDLSEKRRERQDLEQNAQGRDGSTFTPTINQPTDLQAAGESEEPVFDRLYTHARDLSEKRGRAPEPEEEHRFSPTITERAQRARSGSKESTFRRLFNEGKEWQERRDSRREDSLAGEEERWERPSFSPRITPRAKRSRSNPREETFQRLFNDSQEWKERRETRRQNAECDLSSYTCLSDIATVGSDGKPSEQQKKRGRSPATLRANPKEWVDRLYYKRHTLNTEAASSTHSKCKDGSAGDSTGGAGKRRGSTGRGKGRKKEGQDAAEDREVWDRLFHFQSERDSRLSTRADQIYSEECPFSPAINRRSPSPTSTGGHSSPQFEHSGSTWLDRDFSHGMKVSRELELSRNQSDTASEGPVWERLLRNAEETEIRKHQLAKKQAREQRKTCTFRPKLRHRSRSASVGRGSGGDHVPEAPPLQTSMAGGFGLGSGMSIAAGSWMGEPTSPVETNSRNLSAALSWNAGVPSQDLGTSKEWTSIFKQSQKSRDSKGPQQPQAQRRATPTRPRPLRLSSSSARSHSPDLNNTEGGEEKSQFCLYGLSRPAFSPFRGGYRPAERAKPAKYVKSVEPEVPKKSNAELSGWRDSSPDPTSYAGQSKRRTRSRSRSCTPSGTASARRKGRSGREPPSTPTPTLQPAPTPQPTHQRGSHPHPPGGKGRVASPPIAPRVGFSPLRPHPPRALPLSPPHDGGLQLIDFSAPPPIPGPPLPQGPLDFSELQLSPHRSPRSRSPSPPLAHPHSIPMPVALPGGGVVVSRPAEGAVYGGWQASTTCPVFRLD